MTIDAVDGYVSADELAALLEVSRHTLSVVMEEMRLETALRLPTAAAVQHGFAAKMVGDTSVEYRWLLALTLDRVATALGKQVPAEADVTARLASLRRHASTSLRRRPHAPEPF